jgi:catechol 2,3-dioxygenase-like lactoylglutathione lyase family enzyme
MDISFVSSVAVITPDPRASREVFVDALGLPLQTDAGSEYAHSEAVDGIRHFGVWPLSEAAQACFGAPEWPPGRPVPQVSIEFDVDDAAAVQAAAEELRARGLDVLHDAREEPWGQTAARLQSPDGAVVGVSYAPWLH